MGTLVRGLISLANGAYRPATAALGCLLLSACAADESSAGLVFDETEEPLYYISSNVWGHRDLSVCFTFDGFSTEKVWVEEALRGQRSWSSAGNINFVGFDRCGAGGADIAIEEGESAWGWPGERNPADGNEMQLDLDAPHFTRCTTNGLDDEQCIKTVALAEAGHNLSYLHEQNRDDVTIPSSCANQTDDGWDGDATFGDFDLGSIMAYCNFSPELSVMDRRGTERIYGPRFGDSPTLGDYNNDGRADMLCRDVMSGALYMDKANTSGQFGTTDWSTTNGWCNSTDYRRMFQGDFNNDNKTDLLCFDVLSGNGYIDYANSSGEFGGTDANTQSGWCNSSEAQRLYIGDFDGQGSDDLLCFNRDTGAMYIDYAENGFSGTDWNATPGWCDAAASRRLYVGAFNSDSRDDLLCHDLDTGELWIDYASSSGRFGGSDWSADNDWCNSDGDAVYVGRFNNDLRSDLLCHSADGDRWIDYYESNEVFAGTDFTAPNQWCTSNGSRLFVGDVNNDDIDDLVCHKLQTGGSDNGKRSIDLATSAGEFGATDATPGNWCTTTTREFL